MIRRIINGVLFEFVSDCHIMKFSGRYYEYKNGLTAGVRITYPDGTRRFISNSWYSDINVNDL